MLNYGVGAPEVTKDEDNRLQSYPEVAAQTFDGMGAGFEEMFKDPDVPKDQADAADRFVELIDMAPGTRPFRSVGGIDIGVRDRNASDEAHEKSFLEMMGSMNSFSFGRSSLRGLTVIYFQ